jgi:hypothetical protein
MAVPPWWAECLERAEHASTRRTYGGVLCWIVTEFGSDAPPDIRTVRGLVDAVGRPVAVHVERLP